MRDENFSYPQQAVRDHMRLGQQLMVVRPLDYPLHTTITVVSQICLEALMLSTLTQILVTWTVVSLAMGVTWVSLCYAFDGLVYLKRTQLRSRNQVRLHFTKFVGTHPQA